MQCLRFTGMNQKAHDMLVAAPLFANLDALARADFIDAGQRSVLGLEPDGIVKAGRGRLTVIDLGGLAGLAGAANAV